MAAGAVWPGRLVHKTAETKETQDAALVFRIIIQHTCLSPSHGHHPCPLGLETGHGVWLAGSHLENKRKMNRSPVYRNPENIYDSGK